MTTNTLIRLRGRGPTACGRSDFLLISLTPPHKTPTHMLIISAVADEFASHPSITLAGSLGMLGRDEMDILLRLRPSLALTCKVPSAAEWWPILHRRAACARHPPPSPPERYSPFPCTITVRRWIPLSRKKWPPLPPPSHASTACSLTCCASFLATPSPGHEVSRSLPSAPTRQKRRGMGGQEGGSTPEASSCTCTTTSPSAATSTSASRRLAMPSTPTLAHPPSSPAPRWTPPSGRERCICTAPFASPSGYFVCWQTILLHHHHDPYY